MRRSTVGASSHSSTSDQSSSLAVAEEGQIIEVVTWLSLLQTLHRLYAYYETKIGLDEADGAAVV